MNFQETRNNFRKKQVSARELTEESLKKAKERTQRLQDELFLLILEAQKKGHKAP